MDKTYSLKKGVGKGLVSLLSLVGAFVAFAGFNDVSVWQLVEHYVKPLVGALTVGGVITVATNWVKFKFLS